MRFMLNRQFIKFLLVGLLNTLFGYGMFALLTWLGIPYPAAIGLATLAGIAFNFQSTGRLVFGRAPQSRLVRFILVYLVIYCLNLMGVEIGLRLGLNIYVANALVLLPLALVAYLLQRKFVFHAQ